MSKIDNPKKNPKWEFFLKTNANLNKKNIYEEWSENFYTKNWVYLKNWKLFSKYEIIWAIKDIYINIIIVFTITISVVET